jgi:hypothetical protein
MFASGTWVRHFVLNRLLNRVPFNPRDPDNCRNFVKFIVKSRFSPY